MTVKAKTKKAAAKVSTAVVDPADDYKRAVMIALEASSFARIEDRSQAFHRVLCSVLSRQELRDRDPFALRGGDVRWGKP